MSELSPLPDTPLGLYRHYKGGEYEVIGDTMKIVVSFKDATREALKFEVKRVK